MNLRRRAKFGEHRDEGDERYDPQQVACSLLEASANYHVHQRLTLAAQRSNGSSEVKTRLNENLQIAADPAATALHPTRLGKLKRMRKSPVKRGRKPSEHERKELTAQMGDA